MWVSVAILGLLIPAAFLAGLVLSPERLDGVGDPPEPLVVAVEEVLYDDQTGVAVSLGWTEGPALFAPAWSGTVGSVTLQPGDVVRTGDVIATIDGLDRMAVSTPQPFHRPLGRGDSGDDVIWLQTVLAELGYLDELGSIPREITLEVLQAIRGLAGDLGVEGRVEVFDPAWFVWMPEESFPVARVDLRAGGQAPAPGAVILGGPPTLSDVTIQPLEGGVLSLAADAKYQLVVEDGVYPINPSTSSLAEASRDELAMAVPPLLDSVSGVVVRVDPIPLWAIPSSAIQTGGDGRLCIWTASGAGFQAKPVEIVAGRAGVTFLQPVEEEAIQLLVNPAEVLEDPTCPSA